MRYAQTYLGYWWSILQPLASVAVLFLVFQKLIKVPTGGIPYLPFALSGIILWNYFNYVITQSAASLINAQNMISKIYFPRLSLPLSRALVGLIEPLIGFVILIIALIVFTDFSLWGLLAFPLVILLTAMASVGIGLWTSALSIKFRDLQQVLPIALQILFFLTPVAYSSSLVNQLLSESYHFLIYLNPMSGIIELFRCLLFGGPFNSLSIISILVSMLLFLSGLRYFQHSEKHVADIL